MTVKVIPILDDNFCYLVTYAEGKAFIIDPAEPSKIFPVIEAAGVRVTHLFATHKHWDHSGGNLELLRGLGYDVIVVGGPIDNIPGCTLPSNDGDVICLEDGGKGANVTVTCLLTQGHTQGHLCYFLQGLGRPCVFTGDTLFIGGCGKFFEGTPDDMALSLSKLAALPEDTLVYCGHEYTVSNYRFALSIEPNNQDLIRDNLEAVAAREEGKNTVPSTIGKEIKSNVFVRAACEKSHGLNAAELRRMVGAADQDPTPKVLGLVRKAKDNFK